MSNRRQFIISSGAAFAAAALPHRLTSQSPLPTMTPRISTNQYPWSTFYRRDGQRFEDNLSTSFTEVATSGFPSLEPIIDTPEMVDTYTHALRTAGLTMPSIYVNSVLHDSVAATTSINQILRIATRARDVAQTSIVVTNPNPIRWGGPENKTESELLTQGRALERLGAALHREGITLAYHNHDSEFRLGAREYHHMHNATDPDHVKFCLDAHWVFRGSGDSSLAVFDTISLYGTRIVELHIRQSTAGIWNETFAPTGDIDYPRLLAEVRARGINPLLTLEQAVEEKSPHTLNALEAHRTSLAGLLKLIS